MQKTPNDIVMFLLVTTLLILIMGGFILTILFLYRKNQAAFLLELAQTKTDYEKNLLKTKLEIQEQTFQTISREIHDNISLTLILAKLNLNSMDFSNRVVSQDQVSEVTTLLSKAIIDLTDISRSLDSDVIKECGLISAIKQETERINKLKSLCITSNITGDPVFIEAERELFIFRIVQEAFNNILKHANAKNIDLTLYYKPHHLEISIYDDGVGFNNVLQRDQCDILPTAGLRNMRKRSELLGGIFSIESKLGTGTLIIITIPFR